MQYRVDKYLKKAFEAIERVNVNNRGFIDPQDHKIPKEYKGYVSSLGANIIQAGIKAALTFYEADESGSKSDKRLVIAAIKYIINNGTNHDLQDFHLAMELDNLATPIEQQKKAEEIMDAATALKLALRTYKMK